MAALILVVALSVVAAIGSSNSLAETRQSSSTQSLGLERAHAHNDYEHQRPLYDALDHGFKSVEADIWLVNGELLVAHDFEDVQPGRTLRSLYLDPLQTVISQNNGSVYKGDPDFGPRGVKDGAVTAIVSGNCPRELIQQQRVRYAAYDGRLSDLGVATDQTFVPLISDNWTRNFTWMGNGPMPPKERRKLESIVTTAHANGQRVRFWATPEVSPQREAVWRELMSAEVDYINTDHLEALQAFLLENDPNPTVPYVYWYGSTGR